MAPNGVGSGPVRRLGHHARDTAADGAQRGEPRADFYFVVDIVDHRNGPEGKRIELFDYTTKNVISIANTKKLINSTITEVK